MLVSNSLSLSQNTQENKEGDYLKANYHFHLNLFVNNTDAKCLDGTPYGVYYSPGYSTGKKNIIISFRGGGWCKGRDNNSLLNNCLERSNSTLGSSKKWVKDYSIGGGFLGGDPTKNINFYNWHRFDFPYCDGSGHQGQVSDPISIKGKNLYFRGHANILNGLKFVFEKIKFQDINTIVITGCSAGGLATFYWIQ